MDRPIDVQFSSKSFQRRISTYDGLTFDQSDRTYSFQLHVSEDGHFCMPAAVQPISTPHLRSHQCSIVKRQTVVFVRPLTSLPLLNLPHSSPPCTPTVSLVSSLPNGQITRPCKRPSRSRRCPAPCNWPNKPYPTNSKLVTGYPCPSLHTRVLLTVEAKCEMRNGPKIAPIKVFLAPIPFISRTNYPESGKYYWRMSPGFFSL
jgi:hypothetical protein